ncbi:MAG: O-antigen ligase family protein, partial [Mycobacteriales bacterium]
AWVYAALLAAVVAAWAGTPERRRLLVAGLAVAPVLSFARSWLAWWGGQDPTRPYVGTFYWHNQAGIFLALGVLTGVVVVLVGRRTQVLLGWLVIALCGAGVVVSTSRGALAALALGLAVLLVLAALQPRRRLRSVGAVLAVPVVVAATAWLLTGPPFFAARSALLSGTEARSAHGETLSANSAHRLDDWAHAWRVIQHWPLTGAGFHGFAAASKQVDPAGRGSLTPFAHNGFLQLLVDGGLVLAVPVLLLLAALAVSLVRRLPAAVASSDWAVLGGLAALVALVVHSGMDFDWSYPALLGGLAVVSSVLWAPAVAAPVSSRRWRLGLAGAYVVLVALAAVAAWGGILDLNAGLGGQS